MKLLDIQVGMPRQLGEPNASDPMDKPWVSGFFKTTVSGSVMVERSSIEGDGQADLVNHGGEDKAINSYPREHLNHWEHELGIKLPHGAFGENFTTHGLTEDGVCIGDVFRLDRVVVQVSQPRQPCWKLARRWRVRDLAARVERTGKTGWYFRVLEEGRVEAPADFILLEQPHPEWTVALANEIMYHRKHDLAAAHALAACTALSASWWDSLRRRGRSA